MHESFRPGIILEDADASIKLSKIGRSVFTSSIPSHAHGKDNYEIHYIPGGRGKLILDDKSSELSAGTIFIAGPHLRHAQETDKESPLCEYCLNIEVHAKKPEEAAFWDDLGNLMIFDGTDAEWLFKAIYGEAERQGICYKDAIQAYLKLLVIYLKRHAGSSTKEKGKEPEAGRCAIIIEECFLSGYADLTLEALSEKISLSPRQTERLLLRLYRKTFREKLREARISAAADLLRNTDLSISEIAGHAGYSTYSSFIEAFRKETSSSPSEYRKKHRGAAGK